MQRSAKRQRKAEVDPAEKQLFLKIQPQPEQFLYVDKFVDLNVYLIGSDDQLQCGMRTELKCALLYDEQPLVAMSKSGVLVIDRGASQSSESDRGASHDAVVGESGMLKLRVKFSENSMAHGNKKFCLSISSLNSSHLGIVMPFTTSGITVIRHRLVIQNTLPELWYKDEGGQNKCMTLTVHMLDSTGRCVKGTNVPLKVTLCYENKQQVTDQAILKDMKEAPLPIGTDGIAQLKLRIEDVSKNHQNRNFCVKVEADTQQCPMNFDIACDYSSFVQIRSKRNKRARQKKGQQSVTSISALSADLLPPSGPLGAPPPHAPSMAGMPSMKGVEAGITAASTGPLFPPGSIPTPQDAAMRGVIEWAENVIQGLHSIQNTVNVCLTKYAQETMQHLHMLLKLVQEAEATKHSAGRSPGSGLGHSPADVAASGTPPLHHGSSASALNDPFGVLGPPPGAMPGFGTGGKQNSLEMAIAEIGFLQKQTSLDGLMGLGGQLGMEMTVQHPDEDKVYYILAKMYHATNRVRFV
jgi:hypothetical protein